MIGSFAGSELSMCSIRLATTHHCSEYQIHVAATGPGSIQPDRRDVPRAAIGQQVTQSLRRRAAMARSYHIFGIPRLRAAPIMPASAIIVSTATNPPNEGDGAGGNAAATAKKGAGVDNARTLPRLRGRKSRERQPR
jgi:hypothetical protein